MGRVHLGPGTALSVVRAQPVPCRDSAICAVWPLLLLGVFCLCVLIKAAKLGPKRVNRHTGPAQQTVWITPEQAITVSKHGGADGC